MALMTCRFYSEELRSSTSMSVIIPEKPMGQTSYLDVISQKPQVLYLLHGLGDDDTGWLRMSSIERYASVLNLAVVMPRAHRSFYCDEHAGHKYWTFISQELPTIVSRVFNVSEKRDDTFVAGLSMGGYGAFKLALRQPQRFAAAASLSGALCVGGTAPAEALKDEVPQVWSNNVPVGTDDDLLALLQHADSDQLPALYQSCGTEDFLYQDNLNFAAVAKDVGVRVETHLDAPGDHDWDYWDDEIRKVLAWLPLRRL